MDPVNEDIMADSFLRGMIDRERLSFQEQKKHYETSKYFLDQNDEYQSLVSKGKHKDNSRGLVVTARVPKKELSFAHSQAARESPTFSEEDGRSCNSRGRSVSRNVEDRKIMRKIREQRMQGDAMMRRLSAMGSEHDELVSVARNRRRDSEYTNGPNTSYGSSSRQMPPAARDVGLNRRSMSVQEMSSDGVFLCGGATKAMNKSFGNKE